MRKSTIFDLIWLLALGIYSIAGMPITPFHGDETNFIWGSRDFTTVFLHGQPQALMFDDPHTDGAGYLRIMQGSVVHFSIGLTLNVAGFDESALPPRGYNWGASYAENIANGTRPSGEFLIMARASSALYLALSAVVMFGLGWMFGGRPVAYLASGLYALNPAVLLNGHRAMQEGALLFFGLLTMLIAAWIVRKRGSSERVSWRWWLGLSVASAFALASKNTGVFYVAGAFAWILLGDLLSRRWRFLLRLTGRLLVNGALAVALFWAISPGMWHANPLERIRQLIDIRQEQIDSQVAGINHGPASLEQRVASIFLQPYVMPLQPFEVPSWRTIEPLMLDVNRYDASLLSGLHAGLAGGSVLMVLAIIGLIVCFVPRLRPPASWRLYAGLLTFFALNVAIVLVNPLPWQRYFLALNPLVILLTSIGVAGLARALYRVRSRRFARESGKESDFRLLWRSYLPLDSLDGGALHDHDSAPAEN